MHNMKTKALFLSLLSVMSHSAFASETSQEIALLRQQIQLLTQRLDKLESKIKQSEQKQEAIAKKIEEKPNKQSITDRLTFKADFRDRYEYIDKKGSEIRQRDRVRLRAQLGMKVNDKLSFNLGLATSADDPVSTNQS